MAGEFPVTLDGCSPQILVFVRHDEVLALKEFLTWSREINQLPGLQPGFGTFVDFRRCVDINLTTEDIREINKFASTEMAWRGCFSVAHLVSSKLIHGLSRMGAATFKEDTDRVGSFDKVGPALEWIGLPADYQLPFNSEIK